MTISTSAAPRSPSRYARRVSGRAPGRADGREPAPPTSLEPPGEHARGRDFDDDGIGGAQRGIPRVLRILPVEPIASPAKARPAGHELRAALDHHAAQQAPRLRVRVDDDGDLRILREVLHLATLAGADVELPAAHGVADGHDVRHAGGAAGRHAAHALEPDERLDLLREPDGFATRHGYLPVSPWGVRLPGRRGSCAS